MANKVRVCITLSSDLDTTLRQLARDQHTSYSALVDEYLGFALFTKEEKLATELLGPRLQTTIRKEVRMMADKMFHFLSRAALDSATSKQLVFQLLVKEFGSERAFDFRDQAWKVSLDDLKKPLEAFESILNSSKSEDDSDTKD
jgi:hypothetical protein